MRRRRAARIVGGSVVGALVLVAGWWWTRDKTPVDTADRTPAPKLSPSQPRRAPSAPSVPSEPSESREASEPTYKRLVPKIPKPRTLQPGDGETIAWIRKAQDELWNELRKFANDVQLTDEQWRQFERDLLELGAMEAHVWYAPHDVSRDGVLELSDDLEAELAQRVAKYMSKKQLRTFDWRTGGWVTSVRRLYYLPRTVEEVGP